MVKLPDPDSDLTISAPHPVSIFFGPDNPFHQAAYLTSLKNNNIKNESGAVFKLVQELLNHFYQYKSALNWKDEDMINKILLVDDESSFLSGFSRALSRVCHFSGEVQTSANGTDAIKQISDTHFDVCFLDVNLPDICGIDVLKKIKEVSPETKVVIMTASVLDDDMKRDIDRDATMFIPKPIELETVRDFLNRELTSNNGAHPDAKSSPDAPPDEKRTHPRMSCSKRVTYSVSIFYDWQLRSGLPAEVINISQGGVGLITNFPVSNGNIINFGEGFPDKKGIVKWSTQDPPKFRAGIKFI